MKRLGKKPHRYGNTYSHGWQWGMERIHYPKKHGIFYWWTHATINKTIWFYTPWKWMAGSYEKGQSKRVQSFEPNLQDVGFNMLMDSRVQWVENMSFSTESWMFTSTSYYGVLRMAWMFKANYLVNLTNLTFECGYQSKAFPNMVNNLGS